jgi:hypothetical protein
MGAQTKYKGVICQKRSVSGLVKHPVCKTVATHYTPLQSLSLILLGFCLGYGNYVLFHILHLFNNMPQITGCLSSCTKFVYGMNTKGFERYEEMPSDEFWLRFNFKNGNYDVREQGRIDTSTY